MQGSLIRDDTGGRVDPKVFCPVHTETAVEWISSYWFGGGLLTSAVCPVCEGLKESTNG